MFGVFFVPQYTYGMFSSLLASTYPDSDFINESLTLQSASIIIIISDINIFLNYFRAEVFPHTIRNIKFTVRVVYERVVVFIIIRYTY